MDPVTYQVIESRLSGIVREMQEHIFRTGYSTIIRESQDASCMLLDIDGNVVGEHVVLPLHVASLPETVRAIRAAFDDIAPGDAFISNHPYLAGIPHAMDMAVVAPVFHGERLIAFCASIAHKSDLGGVVPGTAYADARELFQEGIQYPPIRYERGGTVVRDVDAILRANTRTPELVLGDLRGQVGVARLGERRLAEVVARYGLDALLETFARKQDIAEGQLRRAIAAWPDGDAEAEIINDDDGTAADAGVRFRVRIEKRGDRILFDFTLAGDQTTRPSNIRPPLVRGCCAYALIGTIDPAIANNGGVMRVIETRFRRGSILDPIFPAPGNAYMPVATSVTEAILVALSEFAPNRRTAGVGGAGGPYITGNRPDGRRFVQYELLGSAYGGRVDRDGVSAISVLLSNSRTAPIEVLENEYPTRVRRFALIPDSGGAGRFRGGLAVRREYEILVDDVQINLRGARHRWPAFGRDGGEPGKVGSLRVNPETPHEQALPSRFSGFALQRGDVVRMDKSGAGGYGDPRRRDPARVIDDLLDGYISPHAATTIYGLDEHALPDLLPAPEGAP